MEPESKPAAARAWDCETDLLVVGSGAAGMTAALVAKLEGLDPLLVEKTSRVGGTTAISGGGIWIPNNHLMEQSGVPDSFEKGCLYLQHTVGDRTPRKKQEAFVANGREMLRYLADRTPIRFRMSVGFPDYYPELPGGAETGRTVYAPVFAGRRLRRDFAKLREHVHEPEKWVATTIQEFKPLFLCKTNPGYLPAAAWILVRNALAFLLGRRHVGMGKALAASLFHALGKRAVPIWLGTSLRELVLDGDRVVGALVEREGRPLAIRAGRGVVLAAGGFARNRSMREEYLPEPATDEWTSAAEGSTGEVIRIGMKTGAAVDLMDDAWWGPTLFQPGHPPSFMLMERSSPGGILVDSAGKRFVNEAASYIDVVHRMYEHDGTGGSRIPAYFVIDQRFRSNYFLGPLPWIYTPRELIASGYLKKAPTLRDLALRAGIDPDGLVETVERFNHFARTGRDPDFQRGDSAYDRSYADPSVRPNPSLAPIEEPPFYAVEVLPGDLDTKGGLVTDECARVLRQDGSVIEGLYAAGNTAASVMGNTYPGGGATLGPAMTFGYLAAMHAAGRRRG